MGLPQSRRRLLLCTVHLRSTASPSSFHCMTLPHASASASSHEPGYIVSRSDSNCRHVQFTEQISFRYDYSLTLWNLVLTFSARDLCYYLYTDRRWLKRHICGTRRPDKCTWQLLYAYLLIRALHEVCNRLFCLYDSLANWDSCPTPAKTEAIEYLKVGPTEIRYSIAWTYISMVNSSVQFELRYQIEFILDLLRWASQVFRRNVCICSVGPFHCA